jgi:hypothetical protein
MGIMNRSLYNKLLMPQWYKHSLRNVSRGIFQIENYTTSNLKFNKKVTRSNIQLMNQV